MNTVISVRTDKEVKNAAQQIAKSIGISLSTMINAYLRQVIVTGHIELYASEQMTPKLEGLISKVEAEFKSGQVSEKFGNASDFLADLKK
ncbi:type II toxin-antitoxin system RelB/DinJ family antitoxin [Patescibacteria group bacterium]|nr:type II toxin-antitoxin system RelB/DinJ family antitoxin [Patescibacteria group bacterium]